MLKANDSMKNIKLSKSDKIVSGISQGELKYKVLTGQSIGSKYKIEYKNRMLLNLFSKNREEQFLWINLSGIKAFTNAALTRGIGIANAGDPLGVFSPHLTNSVLKSLNKFFLRTDSKK